MVQPGYSMNSLLTSWKSFSSKAGYKFLLCGDFNCPGTSSCINNDLDSLFNCLDLTQHVTGATRNSNLLDLLISASSCYNMINNVRLHESGLVSDHRLVTCELDAPTPEITVTTSSYRDLRSIDIDEFRDQFMNSPAILDPATTVDSFTDQLHSSVTGILDRMAPMRTKRFKGRAKLTPWLSDEAKKSKRHRRRLERIWTRTGTDADRLAYRRACRTTNSVIVESRRSYIADQLECATGSKQKWNTVKKLLHPGSYNAAATQDDPGESFANTVAKHFLDKISDLKVAIAGQLGGKSANPLFHDSPLLQTDLCVLPSVTPNEVERLIRSMAGKSSPLDIIPTTLLKRCPDIFSVAISHLANLSFQQGKFPSGYKVAQVTPLLKKDGLDQDNPANYRPISNLFTISKLLERPFLVRLREHVNTSKQFNMYQSAYRHHHSTETALLKILDDVYISIDGKKSYLSCGLGSFCSV